MFYAFLVQKDILIYGSNRAKSKKLKCMLYYGVRFIEIKLLYSIFLFKTVSISKKADTTFPLHLLSNKLYLQEIRYDITYNCV